MQEAFLIKAWFKFRANESLWAQFLHNKYCQQRHPLLVSAPPSASLFWKAMVKVRDVAEENLHWVVGRGDVNLWLDPWHPVGSLLFLDQDKKDSKSSLRDFWSQNQWNTQQLRAQGIPEEIINFLSSVDLSQSDSDLLTWKASNNGQFSTTSTWNIIRVHGHPRKIDRSIWNSHIPKKVSFICWRLFRGWISTDEVNQNKGMVLASKCYCCRAIESTEHLFISGKAAKETWDWFGSIFGIKLREVCNPYEALLHWGMDARHQGDIKLLVAMHILWAIWEARNKAKFENAEMNSCRIIRRVLSLIRSLGDANLLSQKSWSGYEDVAKTLGCSLPQRNPSIFLIRWQAPSPLNYKISTASFQDSSKFTGGGIVRNSAGTCLFAMGFYDANLTSVFEAESEILLLLLQTCIELKVGPIQIESSSISIINSARVGNSSWRSRHIWRSILNLIPYPSPSLSLIQQECNGTARYLAKKAHHLKASFSMSDSCMDHQLQALLILDLVCPHVRLS